MFSRLGRAISFIGRCLRRDDRVHVGIQNPPSVPPLEKGGGRGDLEKGGPGGDFDKADLLETALRLRAIHEKTMPRAKAEQLLREELKSKIRARAADPARSIRE